MVRLGLWAYQLESLLVVLELEGLEGGGGRTGSEMSVPVTVPVAVTGRGHGI